VILTYVIEKLVNQEITNTSPTILKQMIMMLMDEYVNCPLTNRKILINSILFWKDIIEKSEDDISDIFSEDLLSLLEQIQKHDLTYSHKESSNIIKEHYDELEIKEVPSEIYNLLKISSQIFSQDQTSYTNFSHIADNIISLIEINLHIEPDSHELTFDKRANLIKKKLKKHKLANLLKSFEKLTSLDSFKKYKNYKKDHFESRSKELEEETKHLGLEKEKKDKQKEIEKTQEPEIEQSNDSTLLATAISRIKEIINNPGDIDNKIEALQQEFTNIERILGIQSPSNEINQQRFKGISESINSSDLQIDQSTETLLKDTNFEKLYSDFHDNCNKEYNSILDHSNIDLHDLKISDSNEPVHCPEKNSHTPKKEFSEESMNKLLESKKNNHYND